MRQRPESPVEIAIIKSLTQLTQERKLHWVSSCFPYDPAGQHFLISCFIAFNQNQRLEVFLVPGSADELQLDPVLKITTRWQEEALEFGPSLKEFIRCVRGKKNIVERCSQHIVSDPSMRSLWKAIREEHSRIFTESVQCAYREGEKDLEKNVLDKLNA